MTATRTLSFAPSFQIGSRQVGKDAPVLIIAEGGVSHFGDRGKARDLVDLAAEAGADVFKTQAYSTERLISARLPEWRERLGSKEVPFDFIAEMKARCDEHELPFVCTAHDASVLPWLDELDVPAFKIGSGERGNTPYLAEIASRGKPVILSTGMYAPEHVQEAVQAIYDGGGRELALLHCVTSYPTPTEQVNLRAMDAMRDLFAGPVGYSDHTENHLAVLAAVARGAEVVEKHISLDFDVPNAQDWKVSCGPHDLAEFVGSIRRVEALLGKAYKQVQPCEEPALAWALKSLVAKQDLAAGTVLTKDMLIDKRPGDGISPSQLSEVLGRRLNRPLKLDEALEADALEPVSKELGD